MIAGHEQINPLGRLCTGVLIARIHKGELWIGWGGGPTVLILEVVAADKQTMFRLVCPGVHRGAVLAFAGMDEPAISFAPETAHSVRSFDPA